MLSASLFTSKKAHFLKRLPFLSTLYVNIHLNRTRRGVQARPCRDFTEPEGALGPGSERLNQVQTGTTEHGSHDLIKYLSANQLLIAGQIFSEPFPHGYLSVKS